MPAYDDGRKHKRQKREAVGLLWLVEGRRLAGKGRLIDISLNGLCVEVNSRSCPVQANLTLFLHIPQIPEAPKRARLRWYRRVANRSSIYLCGFVFLPPYGKTWYEWVEAYIDEQQTRAADSTPCSFADLVALMNHGGQMGPSPAAPAKPKRPLSIVKKV